MEVDIFHKKIGEKLKEIRVIAGYTSYENFAMDHDIARRYYRAVEKGHYKISIDYLKKILDIHQISFGEFFADPIFYNSSSNV